MRDRGGICRELAQNSQTYEKQNRKNTHQKKKIITRARQYLRGLAICLDSQSCRDFTISRKKYKCGSTIFFSLKKLHQQKRTLITKVAFSISWAQDLQWATKQAKFFFPGGIALTPEPPKGLFMSTTAWAYLPKPPLHGLSLRKFPIKNHATLFELSQVVNWIKHN